MGGFGQWIRNLGAKLSAGLRTFMTGRYGTDKLNMWLLGAGVVACLLSMFLPWALAKLLLTALAYGVMIWAMFRCFSRNTYKRYRENRKYLQLVERIKDLEFEGFVPDAEMESDDYYGGPQEAD